MVKTRRTMIASPTSSSKRMMMMMDVSDDVPNAFPLSPSHSSGSEADSDSSHQKQSIRTQEPFLVTLIEDPLYIHSQIMKEAADKEAIAGGHHHQQPKSSSMAEQEEFICYDPPMGKQVSLSSSNNTKAMETASSMIMSEAFATQQQPSRPITTTKTTSAKRSTARKHTAHETKKQKTSGGGMVLLSVLHTCPRSKLPQEIRTTAIAAVKPPSVLQNVLKRHGFNSLRIRAKMASYQLSVSEVRQASLGKSLLQAIDTSDVITLENMLQQGVSPNASNKFGDDILFTVCKRSNKAVFETLEATGTLDVRIVDSLGRTPLHYCAWAQQLEPTIVRSILRSDPQQLFLEDYRGQTPLDHVNDEVAEAWNDFLRHHFTNIFGGGLPTVTNLSSRTVDTDHTPEHLQAIRARVA